MHFAFVGPLSGCEFHVQLVPRAAEAYRFCACQEYHVEQSEQTSSDIFINGGFFIAASLLSKPNCTFLCFLWKEHDNPLPSEGFFREVMMLIQIF